jgi:ribosomal protein S18 acetylase RimI-like enzyme
MRALITIRDARPEERAALEALQRRSSDVWEEYRAQLAAHPDAIELPAQAIAERRVRVAVGACGELLGFSALDPVRDGACELDGLFVEPGDMRRGVGRELVGDAGRRARAAGARRVDVVANPRAVGFYERVGFRAGAEMPTPFGRGLRMALDL